MKSIMCSMPLLPYHKYLGPGNELTDEEPVDVDDAIAREHDSAYETAVSASDILKADKEAISEFWDDFQTSGNWHSLIGAAGLKLKNTVENKVGVLYPDMSSKNRYKPLTFSDRRADHDRHQREQRQGHQQVRRDAMQDPNQPSTSHDVSDIGQSETNMPMATDAVDAPQAENSVDGKNGVTNPSSGIAPLYLNTSFGSPSLVFFKKSRLMHTWGFASGKFFRGSKDHLNDYFTCTTSLAYLPVDWLPFYLSKSEYHNLPVGSYIKEVSVQVIPKGVRCSFDTGSTLTGSANSMHVIFGKHCIGLNHKLNIVNLKLKQKETSPMVIESVSGIDKNEFTNRFYGDFTEFHSKDTDIAFPTSWGANRALPYYACVMGTTNESGKNTFHVATGWPRVDNVVQRYNLNEHINVPCINYSYKPRNGIIKHRYHANVVPNKVIPFVGHTELGVQQLQYNKNEAYVQGKLSMKPLWSSVGSICEYESIIDKNHLIHSDVDLVGTKAQPQVHFGIEPVQANAPTDSSPNFVNASAEYEISCSCVIGLDNNQMYAEQMISNRKDMLSGYKDNNQHYYLQQNHVGGYYSYNWNGKYDTIAV